MVVRAVHSGLNRQQEGVVQPPLHLFCRERLVHLLLIPLSILGDSQYLGVFRHFTPAELLG